MIGHAAAADATAEQWPAPRRAWTIAVLLALASMFGQFDRVVFNLVVEPIKMAFGLDDTHFALLQGTAFGLFYVFCTIPIGWLADRYERRLILGSSLAFFSLFSIGSGLARSFGQLFATRVGVGVGEASITPTGLSLLSDLFPAQRLGRAISVFLLSAPLGVGVGFLVGGRLLTALTAQQAAHGLPFGLQPWQAAFLLVSLPGLLLSPFLLFMREPRRLGPGAANRLSIPQVLGVIRDRGGALIFMFPGFAMQALMNFAYNIWTPALFGRVYGWTPAQVGLGFGLIMVTCGTSGVYFAGWLGDRLTRRGRSDAHLRVAAWAGLACGVCGAIAPLMPTGLGALALIAPAMFLISMPVPCVGIALQLILPNRARAQVSAFYYMINGLVGLSLGPLLIGLMNDHLFTGKADIRYSLAVTVGCAAPVMWGLLLLSLRPYRALRAAEGR